MIFYLSINFLKLLYIMATFLIVALVILMAFALYKKVPVYGFYDLQTCVTVLLMAFLSAIGMLSHFGINVYCLVFGFFLAVAAICCYGVKSRRVCKVKQRVYKLL